MKLLNQIRALMQMSVLRQTVQLTLVFLVIVAFAGFVSILFIDREINARIDAELETRLADVAGRIAAIGPDNALFYETEDRFVAFQGPGGATYGALAKLTENRPGLRTIKLGRKVVGEDLDGIWRVYIAQAAGGTLAVGTNLDDRDDYLEVLINIFAVSGGLTLVAMLGIGGLLGWRAQRRLSAISGVLDKVAAGDLTARIEPGSGSDDFVRLSRSIDQTTSQLEILLRQTRNLTANIAHDLKTPLTRLRGQLEMIEATAADEDAISVAMEQTDEIIDLFEALLRIAKLESGEHRQRFETLSPARLAEETADIYRAVIEDSGRSFDLVVQETEAISGDRRLILQAVANLIENSLKHTPESARLTLIARGKSLVLADTGPGIPEHLYGRVLEPMYRLEESRTTPGAGLGLALVKTITNLHRAELSMASSQPDAPERKGLRIEIRFP
ncbi:HAMP domain-containing sensor histidine kinase [Roseibium porphyridii]|uniref:histidine kinase n=1 Tax=Roseibium porphyridii TaxID=2866279 RepID=A0ABY8FC16_9HYPH|nr:HAMP domain-containing sensor histidine kinase [Roseibium sp. KMA01]WFE91395.1 HAMP domain-containing sensor histidine kinase [Roseibium sp. KMA01]